MAPRTHAQAVRATVKSDTDINVDGYIRTANALTDKVSSEDSEGLLNEALLFEIETYLAAHFYALRDLQYSEKKTGDASAVFQGRTGMMLESTLWGQQAIVLDLTGFLGSLSKGKSPLSFGWLGKPPSEQTVYKDRD